jgi:hypothetical protein
MAIFRAIGSTGGSATRSGAEESAFCRLSPAAQHIIASSAALPAQQAICASADAVQPVHTPKQGAIARVLNSRSANVLRRDTTLRLCTRYARPSNCPMSCTITSLSENSFVFEFFLNLEDLFQAFEEHVDDARVEVLALAVAQQL